MALVKRILVGRPLSTAEQEHQRIPKVIALAVFSSDAISSTAYATEEILFVTAVGEDYMFRNLGGGKFSDVTAQAGVAGAPADWGTAAAWFDFDNDGDLDLFVGNFVKW